MHKKRNTDLVITDIFFSHAGSGDFTGPLVRSNWISIPIPHSSFTLIKIRPTLDILN